VKSVLVFGVWCNSPKDVPCGLSARGEGGKEADEDCPSGRS